MYTYKKLIGDLIENSDVIDLACGTGYYTRILREKTKGEVYGVDISEDMIEHAKSQLKHEGEIHYIVADVSHDLPI